MLVAYGAFALLAALVGAVTVALSLDTELAHNDQATVGRSSAVVVTAVEVTTSGFNLNAVGIILMIAGALGLVLSLLFWSSFSPYRRSRTVAGPDTVVEERRIERDLP